MDAGREARRLPTPGQNRLFFGLTLALFLLTRLWGLERFPIFFFCDEAVQMVQADRLADRGFRDDQGTLLPTYFRNTEFYNLSLGVYLQVLPEKLFGRSVFVARAVPVFVLFSAMAAVGLMLRDFFRLRFWWVGVLALSAFPGWFLHTRIAFELMLATSCYVWFLYFYLRYRSGRTGSAYAAAVFGALTFYGYNTFQPVIVATVLLLLAVDAPHHWRKRGTVALVALLLLLLALPYARFVRAHPREVAGRLRSLDSYWTQPDKTLPEKLGLYAKEYARAFSPRYWFLPEAPEDIDRHRMKGYPHLPLTALPFAAAGIGLCAWRIREPAHRALLVALAAAPLGAAIVRSGITRTMTLVVLLGMLVGVAADPLLVLLSRRLRPALVGAAVFLSLAAAQGAMLADALSNGPTWYREYGLYGMQWGAREIFGEVRRLRQASPDALIVISPDWANGMNDLVEFFSPGSKGIVIANVDWLLYQKQDIPPQTLAVLTEEEYQRAARDRRLDARLVKTILYPDGRPGFRFARVRYADDFDRILSEEKKSWRRLLAEEVEIDGRKAEVDHSAFDIGEARHLFDGDDRSIVRTANANPATVAVKFDSPRPLRELVLALGSMQCEIRVEVSGPAGEASYAQTYRDLPRDPTVTLALPPVGGPVSSVRISVRDINSGEPAHVHLREIRFLDAPQRRKSARLQETTRFWPRSETLTRPNASSTMPVGDFNPSAL